MKWWLGLVAVVCLGGAVGLAWHARKPAGARASLASASAPATSPGPLGVEALMRHVNAHRDPTCVEGVVASVVAPRHLFTLIDRKEFAECATLTCAELRLPVQWNGVPPKLKETVRVNGQVKNMAPHTTGGASRLVFVASAVRKAP